MRVVNSAGTSNALNLTIGPTDPIEIVVPGVVLGGGTFVAETLIHALDELKRAYDEARGLKHPRLWTAKRDRQMWKSIS